MPEVAQIPILTTKDLAVQTTAGLKLIDGINLEVAVNEVFGVIGPSGAGKSTLLKCFNRLIDLTTGLSISGDVRLHGESIYARGVDPDAIRVKIGMLFQQPVVFPTSIFKNVVFGVKRLRLFARAELPEVAERSLREAALWDQVKDRLHESAATLSVGQQQRLCLARTLASRPEVILMDEPTSALDPQATERIEELVVELKSEHAVIIVTHDMLQARRVTDRVAWMEASDGAPGRILEIGPTQQLLDSRG